MKTQVQYDGKYTIEYTDSEGFSSAFRVTKAFAQWFEALQDERDEVKDTLKDLCDLRSEYEALTGGGPGWQGRWEKAFARANERFEP